MEADEGMVYAPDMEPEEDGEKLSCFIEPSNVCGPHCMAYLTSPADVARSELDRNNQAHCIVLVSADRLARHAVILTQLFATSEKKKRTAEQDRKREDATPKPPRPFGGQLPTDPFPVGGKPR